MVSYRGRGIGKERGTPQEKSVNEVVGRGRGMLQLSQTSYKATKNERGLGTRKRPIEHEYISKGQTIYFKRLRIVEIEMYQVEMSLQLLI